MSPEWFFSLDDCPADVAREWRGFMHACDVFLQEVWTSKRFPAYITLRVTGEVCLNSGGAPLEVAGQGWTLPHHPHLATPNSRAHVVPLQQAVGYPRVLLLNVQSKFSFLVKLKITKVDITTVFLCPRSNLSIGPRFVRQSGELDEGERWKGLEGEGALVAHTSLLKQHSRTFFASDVNFITKLFKKESTDFFISNTFFWNTQTGLMKPCKIKDDMGDETVVHLSFKLNLSLQVF